MSDDLREGFSRELRVAMGDQNNDDLPIVSLVTAFAEERRAVREWLRGCSNAAAERPWECIECTDALVRVLRKSHDCTST